jgi:hypothetical protein
MIKTKQFDVSQHQQKMSAVKKQKHLNDFHENPPKDYYEKRLKAKKPPFIMQPSAEELEEILRIEDELWNS